MCYICEARGRVGKNYRAAQKAIAEAKRALPGRTLTFGKPWEKAPSHRLWSLADLKAYGKDVTP